MDPALITSSPPSELAGTLQPSVGEGRRQSAGGEPVAEGCNRRRVFGVLPLGQGNGADIGTAMRRLPVRTAVAIAAATLVACGAPGTEVADGAGPEGEPIRYDCYGVTATAEELESAPRVAELTDRPGAQAFARVTDDLDVWAAIDVEDALLGAIRPLDPPEVLDGEVRDHERLVVERMGEPGDGEADAEGWMVTSAGPCALRAVMDGLGAATVLLDPDAPPESGATSVSLWVVEGACASGMPATDRVVVSVEESADEVRFVVGVEPLGGDQSCPSNPPTPVNVELDEPIGERRLVDAARLPPIELEEAPPELRTAG
jgi:hypothetical protein